MKNKLVTTALFKTKHTNVRAKGANMNRGKQLPDFTCSLIIISLQNHC